jgi:predicted metalloendopeptidase
MHRYILTALSLALSAGLTHAAEGATHPASNSGIARADIDPLVRPQDDFFRYVNGKWLRRVQIPADRSRWGSVDQMNENTQVQLRGIVEGAAAAGAAQGADMRRIGDLYASFMDEVHIESLGLAPLRGELERIAAVRNRSELPALLARLGWLGVSVPVDNGVDKDRKDARRNTVYIVQSGLALPERDYYLSDDAGLVAVRTAYRAYVERILGMAGDADAAAHAQAVLDFETALAKIQWGAVELRDPVKAYNKVGLAEMDKLAPGYDWKAWLDAEGLSGRTADAVVMQPTYLRAFVGVADATPLSTWKAYLTMHLIDAYADYLPRAFAAAHFDFYNKTLAGDDEIEPRWKRGVAEVERAQGNTLGRLYVARYFPPARKARIEALVQNLLAAYRRRVDTLDWMSPATKREAKAKLAMMKVKIGYPARWKDESDVVIRRDDVLGNIMRARIVAADRGLDKLGKPIDRDAWTVTPQTVNGGYVPTMNEIVFPAAFLQAPFFDPDADDAFNYGGIGAVIGHELSHGFDDQGAQYDGNGNLRDWWTAADRAQFVARTAKLVEQYGRFEPLPGYRVDGALTLGENIADNAGLAIAYDAYTMSLKGKPAAVIDGLSGSQRFYMGFGQASRAKMREQRLITQVKSDPHAPEQCRVNGTLRNQPGFYDAFGVKQGDGMYLAPQERVRIW